VVQVKADILPLVLVAQAVVVQVALVLSEPLEPQTPEAVVVAVAIPDLHLRVATAQVVSLSSATLVQRQEPPAAP
jgi:hypothetical protein